MNPTANLIVSLIVGAAVVASVLSSALSVVDVVGRNAEANVEMFRQADNVIMMRKETK